MAKTIKDLIDEITEADKIFAMDIKDVEGESWFGGYVHTLGETGNTVFVVLNNTEVVETDSLCEILSLSRDSDRCCVPRYVQ